MMDSLEIDRSKKVRPAEVNLFADRIPATVAHFFESNVQAFKSKVQEFEPKVQAFKLKVRSFESKVREFQPKARAFGLIECASELNSYNEDENRLAGNIPPSSPRHSLRGKYAQL